MVVNFFLKGIVLIFWHTIVYHELLYCMTKVELVWTWIKVAVVGNAKKHQLYPTFPNIIKQEITHLQKQLKCISNTIGSKCSDKAW